MIFDLTSLCVEPRLTECGSRVPDCGAYVERIATETASEVARWWPVARREYVTAHMLALMWHESRLNRCAVGPGARLALGLPGRGQEYDEATIIAAAEKVPQNTTADLGPAQILLRYARTEHGRATASDMVRGASAIPTAVYNMHLRQAAHLETAEPWGYWPSGNTWSLRYVRKIGRLAARILGGGR